LDAQLAKKILSELKECEGDEIAIKRLKEK
jgi:hypothetical protein